MTPKFLTQNFLLKSEWESEYQLMQCCKDHGVEEDCMGKCRIMRSRSWPDYTGCETHKSAINTCWSKGNFLFEPPVIFRYYSSHWQNKNKMEYLYFIGEFPKCMIKCRNETGHPADMCLAHCRPKGNHYNRSWVMTIMISKIISVKIM